MTLHVPPLPPLDRIGPTGVGLDARYPIALLPVRLETRLAGNQLKVRIFPDEIFADTHEPGLTADEQRDGAAYVATIHTAAEPEQWAALVARYGAPRAAWVALASAKGSPATRAESWTRAAQASLPDSWIVRAHGGGQAFTATIPKVRRPLALTVSPARGPQVAVSDQLTVDADLEWTVHYDAAVAAGMAVTLDLTRPDPGPIPAGPASRLPPLPRAALDVVVVGVRHDGAAAGADYLHALFDAHHYARGFAFVAPGTPTSNTGDAAAAFPPADPGARASFAVERQAPLVAPGDGSDGERFARMLGLAASSGERVAAVEHVDGAARQQDATAAAMNAALWPATLGYFMEQMMAPKFDAATIAGARGYFLANVRPGGPLPAFRIGRVPYGLLPAVSLTRWKPDGPLAGALRQLRDRHFVAATASVPRVTAGSSDPDGDLLKALAIDASCRRVRMRALLGEDVTRNTAGLLGGAAVTALALQQAARAAAASALLAGVGLGADTRMGHLDPGAATELVGAPLVTSAPLSETTGVDYIHTLIAWAGGEPPKPVDFAAIRDDKLPGADRPLLYRVLRHALLLEMDRASRPIAAPPRHAGPIGLGAAAAATTVAPIAEREPELVKFGATAPPTAYDRIGAAATASGFVGRLQPYLDSLKAIASLPSAELERRFGETLDACSHRLDAWITSLATARLHELRSHQPTGCHVGAFGWVEGVRPAGAAAAVGGFIHAPSAAHAATAAILRNGYLSRGGGSSPYAVDLSSARVRHALDVLDGTRQGEPLSALLGYRFERELHERGLERLIADLRRQHPLVAGRTPEGTGPTELVAASNVVDGLAVRAARPMPSGLTTDDQKRFTDALGVLDEAVDGLADLLTAESVFQAVRGNPTAAAAGLDAMAQGVLPPEPDVVRSPRGGTGFTQRLVIALDGAIAAPPHATPRAAVEPFLDAWAGLVLGDLSQVGCRVVAADGTSRPVTMDRLGLRPLDLVALARTPASGLGDAELDRRVLDAAGATAGARVDHAASPTPHSFAERMELARALAALVGGARALLPGDLVSPADSAGAAVTDRIAQDAATRARTALTMLASAASALTSALAPVAAKLADATKPPPSAAELAALRAALRSAALLGVAGAYPAPAATSSELASLARAAQNELASRAAGAPALTATDASSLLAAATATVEAVFGRDFVLLPQLAPPAPAALAASLAESSAIVADPNLPRRVLQQVARVRPGVGRWRSLFLYAEALGTLAPTVDVAQLPAGQAAWAAQPGAAPANGTISLLLHRPMQTAPAHPWAGLVIDEWNELIPSATQPTSIAFHHDNPVAEAPQAVLLAVPPTTASTWDNEALVDTVRETLILAKLRLVEPVDGLRPFLPAICLTGNTANETVSTNLIPALIAEPTIRSV